ASAELVESLEVLEALLEERFGALDATTRAHAETHRAELAQRVPTLVVRATTPLEVEVDDRSVGRVAADGALEVRLGPGAHAVRGIAAGGASVRREVQLAEGERAALLLAVPMTTPRSAPPAPAPTRDDGGVD